MLAKIRYKEVRVRRPNSHLYHGNDKFTGTVTYAVVGKLGGSKVRHSLGTGEKNAAVRRVRKLEGAIAEGPESPLWPELGESLPTNTFAFFADRVGYIRQNWKATATSTWQDLVDSFEVDMQRRVDNKGRGAGREEGSMSTSTRDRYRQTIRHFDAFLQDKQTPLTAITPAVIAKFKVARHKAITALTQARGGTSIALDIAVLHAMFAFGVAQKMTAEKPIDLKRESKPGKNPKNGARPFMGEELAALRKAAKHQNSRKQSIDDTSLFLLLRWTGLRASDAANLRWNNIHFGRGANGEIELLTQKRGKIAIVPLSTELREDLEAVHKQRKPHPEDSVLFNPQTGAPLTSRVRLGQRVKGLCQRAGVKGSAHCFRDTFACDMLARGNGIYEVAQMLADTVETVQKCYAQFVPAARDAVQAKMDTGVGIEEQARIAAQRRKKVVEING